jgi:SpoIID/LytB domain protein
MNINYFRTKLFAVILITTLILSRAINAEAAVLSEDIRVLLSTASYKSMDIEIVGDYHIKEASDFNLNSDDISIWIEGNRPVLRTEKDSFTASSITLVNNDPDGTSSYARFYNASHGFCTYIGDMQFSSNDGSIRVINTLPIEHYLYGVVPYEMSNRFPFESLKAQAVCARGYSAIKCFQNSKQTYDILDTANHQVYCGYASKYTRAISAVNETKGQVLANEGNIIEAFYTASNGGQTEITENVWKNNLPYVAQKNDLYDVMNPDSPQQKTFIPSEFNAETIKMMDGLLFSILQSKANDAAGDDVALLSTIIVKALDAIYDFPSRSYSKVDIVLMASDENKQVGQITVTIDFDELIFTEENDKGIFNIKRPKLLMRGAERGSLKVEGKDYEADGWFLTNRRYGHGIGLSQRGAQQRATSGQDYREILDFYYINTDLFTFESLEFAPALYVGEYNLSETGISHVELGVQVSEFLHNLSTKNGIISLISSKGQPKTQGIVGTGDFVRNVYGDGTTYSDLPIVVFGDISGDGQITDRDLDLLQWHLLSTRLLKGAYLSAADVNKDGHVDNNDALIIIWHINGKSQIS